MNLIEKIWLTAGLVSIIDILLMKMFDRTFGTPQLIMTIVACVSVGLFFGMTFVLIWVHP